MVKPGGFYFLSNSDALEASLVKVFVVCDQELANVLISILLAVLKKGFLWSFIFCVFDWLFVDLK